MYHNVIIFFNANNMMTNLNEAYGVHSDYIETTPNEVYGLVQISQQFISTITHSDKDGSQSYDPIFDVINLS